MGKPPVTFAIFTYNQERFVREAVRGALAQTYSPLEIVICDDCSTDGTLEAAREELAGYRGPHRVLLSRNRRNLGIGGNINRAVELSKGDLIVCAGGDDVSLPTRTEELARAWSGGGVSCVYSDVSVMDADGADAGAFYKYAPVAVEDWRDVVRREHGVVLGCSVAFDRAVFETFGPMPEGAMLGDYTIEFRSALLGRVACVEKRLVKYRRHVETITGHNYHELDLSRLVDRQARWARGFVTEYEGWLRDLRLFAEPRPEMEPELTRAAEIIAARISFHEFKVSSLESHGTERLRECARAVARVRTLGLLPVAKTALLGVSPRAYYGMTKKGLAHTRGRPIQRGLAEPLRLLKNAVSRRPATS